LDEFRNNRLNEKQPTGVGAGQLITNLQNSITVSLSGNVGKSNVG